MQIELNNLAAMRQACIEIDGITVIAGENDTGKSTVSKALWCIFDSLYKYEEQFDSYRSAAIEDAVRTLPRELFRQLPHSLFAQRFTRRILNGIRRDSRNVREVVSNAYADTLLPYMSEGLDVTHELELLSERIEQVFSYDDGRLMCGVIESNLLSEFSQQPCNVDDPSLTAYVTLTIKGEPIVATIADNQVKNISSLVHLDVRAIYIDDSFILDDVTGWSQSGLFYEDRHMRLRRLLNMRNRSDGNVLTAMMTADQLSDVFEKIGRALPGELARKSARELVYVPEGYWNPIDVRNISAGMKMFAILSLLLQNGSIERKSTIILDEPEVHLHPEWQLLLAELIVLLQKAFDLHVLLTTHSPYFLRAIQVYSAKHSIATRCRYYQSSRDGKWCDIVDVTEHTEPIFDKLVRPFEELEREMSVL